MSQEDFMKKDECLVLNYCDEVIGYDNKYNVHKFVAGQPKGVVHRAFSVMLFDGDGKLLLQQRAASKVTFPTVWTNTCCSHPLFGQTPDEVDPTPTSGTAEPMGIKHAAVRKLRHELGTKRGALAPERFKYMGRVHYWAADTVTHGQDAPWGEHEIDYLLLLQLDQGETLELEPNPDEVMDVKWVSSQELDELMAPQSGLLWSPWFRIICRDLLKPWWKDLKHAFTLKPFAEIRRFDGPPEHHKRGGCHSGAAGTELSSLCMQEGKPEWGAWGSEEQRKNTLRYEREARRRDLTHATRSHASAAANKQGAYGKVPTHSHSKLSQLMRPSEVLSGLYLKLVPGALPTNLKVEPDDADLAFCDEKLGEVSRSFAAVIRQLPQDMAVDILIFYLVLRALDTIEDDMEAFKADESEKCRHLRDFGSKYLGDEAWNSQGWKKEVGEGAERVLLEQFDKVSRVFNRLTPDSREVIRDITIKMGAGMAEYVYKDMGQGTTSLEEYARYCHMVAGLVGEGLSRAFVVRKYESPSILGQGSMVWPFCDEKREDNLGLANSMGLFLQKTNIIRDYLEDYADHRAFWPQDVWKKFARTSDLGEFARPTAHGAGLYPAAFDAKSDPDGAKIVGKGTRTSALACLNFLVADALELVPDCLEYLERLRTAEIFRFSAIPQVMAIATLEECFDNPRVFSGVVKIRRGLTARLLLDSSSLDGVHLWFHRLAKRIAERCPPTDPSTEKIQEACAQIVKMTTKRASARERTAMWTKAAALVGVIGAYVAYEGF